MEYPRARAGCGRGTFIDREQFPRLVHETGGDLRPADIYPDIHFIFCFLFHQSLMGVDIFHEILEKFSRARPGPVPDESAVCL